MTLCRRVAINAETLPLGSRIGVMGSVFLPMTFNGISGGRHVMIVCVFFI